MDKKAERLRYSRTDDNVHTFILPIGKDLFKRFKAQCVYEEVLIKDKILDLIVENLDQASAKK